MTAIDKLLEAFETHSPDGIREAVARGADAVSPVRGRSPVLRLIEMYTRSPRFAACMQAMRDAGATLDDPLLEAILLDDDGQLRDMLRGAPRTLARVFDLACAYTSLREVSALHVCAEYNCTRCARVLLEAGMDVDTPAAVDKYGHGGQTPLFHTVNSNGNHCRPMMELLVEAGADLDVRVAGLVWGAGFQWETTVFDVTPISYAQAGLYPQFHRREEDIYSNVEFLYLRRHGSRPPVRNVPNDYVARGFDLDAARSGQRPKRRE